MAPYDKALDERLDLLRWWGSADGAEAVKHVIDVEGDYGFRTQQHYVDLLSRIDSIYVDSNACKLIRHATDTFKPQPIVPSDLYTKQGFVYLDEPMALPEHSENMRAFHWHEQKIDLETWIMTDMVGNGVFVDFYCDRPERVGDITETIWHRMMPIYSMFLPYHTDFSKRPHAWDETAIRTFQTFLVMVQQKITVATETQPSRQARKRATRAGAPSKLVVMSLPRRVYEREDGESGEAHYSHSFLVSGHWRNQWYPSLKLHRQKWIAPYVKGEGEFVAKDRVGTLRR